MADQKAKPLPSATPVKPAVVKAKIVAAAATPKAETAQVSKPVAKRAYVRRKPVVVPAPVKAAPVAAKPAPVVTKAESAKIESIKVEPAKPVVVETAVAQAAAKPAPVEAHTKPAPEKPVVAKQETAPAPASAKIEGSNPMNEAVKKVEETTRKFTADAGQKMQAMFGEASERAKGAYEKSLKMAEEMTEFSKGNVEAVVESSKLAAKGAESLGQEAADYARKSFESSTAAFKNFASAKSPTELFKLQSDYMKSSFDAAVAESSKVTEAWLKLAGEIVQPVSNRFAVAMEKARSAAL